MQSSDSWGSTVGESSSQLTAVFLQNVLDAIPDATMVIGQDHQVLYANEAARAMAGIAAPISGCLKCYRVSHQREGPCGGADDLCPLQQVTETRAAVTLVHRHRNATGGETFVEITAAPICDEAGNVVQIVETCRDITDRGRTRRLLEIANRHAEMPPLLRDFVAELKRFSGCEAVGIRILGDNQAIPYEVSDGFSPEFHQSKNLRAVEQDPCWCTRIVTGRLTTYPAIRTEGGSFYTGNMTRLMETVPREVIGLTRNVCHAFGYESVALIPIRLGDEVLGLVHLADPRVHAILPDIVESIERAALLVGTAIQRARAEDALRRSRDELDAKVRARTAELTAANRLLEDEVHERNRLEREILHSAAREQQRIGQELHDGVGQELTGLSYVARSVYQRLVDQGSADADLVAELDFGIARALGQIRAIAKGLLPLGIGPDSLVPALESLASQVEEWSAVSCRFECACHEPVADNEAAIQLYRIAQEALTNAVKHGGAREIVVALSKDARGVTLEIRDDGVGVPAEAETAEGAGLRIMHYRASVIGAMLEVRQQPGGGTLIRCTRPQG